MKKEIEHIGLEQIGGGKMKRQKVIIAVLICLCLLIFPVTALAAEKDTTQKIVFTFDEGDSICGKAPDPGDFVAPPENRVPTSLILSGVIKDKNGTLYLSPLTGIIIIDGIQHHISVQQAKQSDPVSYYEEELNYSSWKVSKKIWYCFVEANIEGTKYIGTLSWQENRIESSSGFVYETKASELYFQGFEDGERTAHWLYSPELPELN